MLIHFEYLALLIILTTYTAAMTQPGDLFSSGPFVRWLKYMQLSERQRKNIFFCYKKEADCIFYAKCIVINLVNPELGLCQYMFSLGTRNYAWQN